LSHAAREYFDDDDFMPLYELAEQLADTLATRSSSSAGFPSESAIAASPSQSMRPGAHPPLSSDEDAFASAATQIIGKAARLARARLNRLIDVAHERGFTLIELRDAAARASDFTPAAATALASQASHLVRQPASHSTSIRRADDVIGMPDADL
jgi:hypothetical protein